jgi:Xaa-Pro dipeptidase
MHARRRARLRGAVARSGIDALLVTDLINVRYLTGFTGSNAALLIVASDSEDNTVDEASATERTQFCTDGRYTTQSAQEVPDLPRLIERPCDVALLRRAPEGLIGFEARSVSVADHMSMLTAANDAGRDIELVPMLDIVEALRAV